MPSKQESVISSVGSQKDNRYPDTFVDQHRSERMPDGRPWNGVRELAANKGEKDGFCSALIPGDHANPAQHWEAPWYPEHRFFKFNYQRSKITIDYVAMATHDQEYHDLYYEAAALISMEKGLPPTEEGALPPYMVRQIMKMPPRSPKIAAACLAGDLWILGFSVTPNEELRRLLGQMQASYRDAAAATLAPKDVLSVTSTELNDMIANAVAVALQAASTSQLASVAATADRMAAVRAGKKAKRQAQQEATV